MFKKLLPIFLMLLLLWGCASTKQVEYGGKRFTVDTADNTISDGSYTYCYAVSKTAVEITYPNGAWFTSAKNGISYSADYQQTVENMYTAGGALAEAVRKVEGNPESRLFSIVCAVLLGGIGLALLLFPEVFFYLRFGWMLQDAEPSDTAIFRCRFGGGVVIALTIIYLIINQ